MRLKKFAALTLAGVMAASLVACSGGDSSSSSSSSSSNSSSSSSSDNETEGSGDKLVIWTQAVDLQQFADKYTEETGVETEVVIINVTEYATKIEAAILAGETEPDIIVGEPDMLESYYEAGLCADLDALGASEHAGEIADYVWEFGKDSDGIQRTISYQITPTGIFYRRDIAEEVFGSSDPEEVGKLFASYDAVLSTAKTLKDAGYRIFSSIAELGYFNKKDAWVVDGTLNLAQSRLDYMDVCNELYTGGYTANAAAWSAPWYTAMQGQIPAFDTSANVWDEEVVAEAEQSGEMTEVFAYGFPAWGVITMRDNYGDTAGKWGICAGPSVGYGGGTYIGISENSEKKEEAWKFIEYVCFNQDTLDWWIEESKGDTVSNIEALERHKDDENPTYGNQKVYQFFQDEAEQIDLSIVTSYDRALDEAWGNAINSFNSGEKTREEAINDFYDIVESTYPEIQVNR